MTKRVNLRCFFMFNLLCFETLRKLKRVVSRKLQFDCGMHYLLDGFLRNVPRSLFQESSYNFDSRN
jgi:hypothetical protein